MIRIRARHAIVHGSMRLNRGDEGSLPDGIARELVRLGRAVFVDPAPPADHPFSAAGEAPPSSASPAAPASPTTKSNPRGKRKPKVAAASSSSTTTGAD